MNEEECKAFWEWLLKEGEMWTAFKVFEWLQYKRDEWEARKQYGED